MSCSRLWRALWRIRPVESAVEESNKPKLARVLGLIDLTGLGVGSTLGLGVYVLAGAVAKTVAGPAVCLSFLVAAIASAFAGICYAEFAARVPQAGSAYIYSYVSVGEFIAFSIGWNLILEYVIGTASVAKGMANYIDALFGDAMKKAFTQITPIHVSFLADYMDFFAFALVIAITLLLAIGVNESAKLNNIFTTLNLVTVITVVIAGSTVANVDNWRVDPNEVPDEYKGKVGVGGFMPFGIAGVMAGAAKCFFGFVGFDAVATTGEEAKNPEKDIPLSIAISLIVIFVSYFSISTVLTMMWPYFLQDADAPFPYVFTQVGMPVIKWVVTLGAIFALCSSLLGAMFPLPRILYAMSKDGVLFKVLSRVNKRTHMPILATFLGGILTGIMAALFNLNQLIDMMSIGTLLAYTIVAICVLVLRFESSDFEPKLEMSQGNGHSVISILKLLFNLNGMKHSTRNTSIISNICIFIYFCITVAVCSMLAWGTVGSDNVMMAEFIALVIFVVAMFLLVVILARQPTQDVRHLVFKVPFVPLLPCVSIFMNTYLMVQLDMGTWIRFIGWLIVGYLIYFLYGIRHSEEGKNEKKEKASISQASTIAIGKRDGKEITRF